MLKFLFLIDKCLGKLKKYVKFGQLDIFVCVSFKLDLYKTFI